MSLKIVHDSFAGFSHILWYWQLFVLLHSYLCCQIQIRQLLPEIPSETMLLAVCSSDCYVTLHLSWEKISTTHFEWLMFILYPSYYFIFMRGLLRALAKKKKKKEKTVNQICSDKKFANSHIPQGCKTGSHECGALTESRGSHVYEWFSQVYQASLLIFSHIGFFKQNLLMVGCWSHCFKGLCKCWWDARIQRKRTFRLLNITTGFSYFSLPGHINSL